MEFLQIFLIGVSLSMDAFAVAICKGLGMRRVNKGQCFVIALFFGAFQALMPTLGWFLGSKLDRFIAPVDHWIVFVLLGFIGGKMVWDALHEDEAQAVVMDAPLDLKELLLLAIATSIDAFAVGVTLAMMAAPIFQSAAIIGLTTFGLSVVGVYVGNHFGSRYEKKATLAGGVILILIGCKVLLEHLGILAL